MGLIVQNYKVIFKKNYKTMTFYEAELLNIYGNIIKNLYYV